MRISTKDPAEMSAAQINKELDRLDEIDRRLGEEMIEAGRGYERPSEYLRMTDPLSMKLRRVSDRHSKLRAEIRARYGPGEPSRLPRGYGPLKLPGRRNPVSGRGGRRKRRVRRTRGRPGTGFMRGRLTEEGALRLGVPVQDVEYRRAADDPRFTASIYSLSGRRLGSLVTVGRDVLPTSRNPAACRRRRQNPDDSFWDEFAAPAARAFWAEAYIREVEDLAEEESENYDEKLHDVLSPGPGGEWLDVTPPTPESALREGEAFTAQARKNVPADVLPLLEDLGAETAGWYAAMGAMGHGVGLWDYDVPDEWVGYWEPGVDVQNDAYDAVREAAADYYGE